MPFTDDSDASGDVGSPCYVGSAKKGEEVARREFPAVVV